MLAPELFDPKFPYKEKEGNPLKKENEFGEYFQLSLFLLVERLKSKESFWFPFIDYLPKENNTLYTYPDDTKISSDS